jgi:AraC family transcriptional regulator of adaptative response/methylated-DNA-[protein]-cysteine methyltransferase
MAFNITSEKGTTILNLLCFYQKQNNQVPFVDVLLRHFNLDKIELDALFLDWAGVSFERFLQFVSKDYLQKIVSNSSVANNTLFDYLGNTNLFVPPSVNIQLISASEMVKGGQNLEIQYSFGQCVFGNIIIASTKKGICYLSFYANKNDAFVNMRQYFLYANFYEENNLLHQQVTTFLNNPNVNGQTINLHLQGTAFQLKVWEKLLQIPFGALTTYGKIAQAIGDKNASRAVGSAVGSNVIAFIIPCHRVVASSYKIGQYRWNSERKAAILGWEAAKLFSGK